MFSILEFLHHKKVTVDFVLKGSLAATTIDKWVQNLAINQTTDVSIQMRMKPVFLQEDG
jgi:hypothetical protein